MNDLEMHDLLRLIYPKHIKGDEDEYFELSQDTCNNATVDLGDGFQPKLSDLLERVIMLTMPMGSPLTEKLYHCLGEVYVRDGSASMIAVVKREVIENAKAK